MVADTGVKNVALVKLFDEANPTLWLTVGDKKYMLVQYNATFALNEIPTASCTLAAGERITQGRGGQFSPAEDLTKELSGVGLAKATVTLAMRDSDWKPNDDGFTGTKVIFEGYYAGVAYHRVGSKIQLTVSLVHKLVDLTFGSIFSENMHPSNPASLINDAATLAGGGCNAAVAGATGGVWTKTGFLGEKLPAAENPRGVDPGFGAELIQVLKCCAKLNLFKISCNPNVAANLGVGNEAVTAILDNIASETGALSSPLDKLPFPPAISSYVAGQLESARGTTFWDLLVNKWCPDFMLAVSPLPSLRDGGVGDNNVGDYATIIPNIPTLRTPYINLYLNDYVTFEMRASQHKPLMAVGIFSSTVSSTGATWKSETPKPDKGRICIGGMYPTENLKATGQFLALNAPVWLQNVLVNTGYAGVFASSGGATASDPGNAVDRDKMKAASFSEHKAAINEALDKLAHTYFMANALRGRGGSFGSKLRFDIAPGTIVKLWAEKNPDSQGGAVKNLPANLLGQVTRVTFNINADSPVARTDFDVVAIRNEEENKDPDYTSDVHPFVEGQWRGGTLVKGWDFLGP